MAAWGGKTNSAIYEHTAHALLQTKQDSAISEPGLELRAPVFTVLSQ